MTVSTKGDEIIEGYLTGWYEFSETVNIKVIYYVIYTTEPVFDKRWDFNVSKATDIPFFNESSFPACAMLLLQTEATIRRCSVKKSVLKNFQNSQENNCVRTSFHKSCKPRPATLLNNSSGIGVFLWISRKF